MIRGNDSSFSKPTGTALLAAINAGVKVWGGYIATKPNVGLAAPWELSDFDNVRVLGGEPLAFCSGWDDPVALRELAAQWHVRLILDDEEAIRPDGDWKLSFLQVSGAGLYGGTGVHTVAASCHILALYLGHDPQTTWWGNPPPDNNPRGWQWQGTHSEFGISVDSLWLDDSFGGPMALDPNDPVVKMLLQHTNTAASILALGIDTDPQTFQPDPSRPRWLTDRINELTGYSAGAGRDIKAELDIIKTEISNLVSQGIPPANLQPVQDAISRLATHLGEGTA